MPMLENVPNLRKSDLPNLKNELLKKTIKDFLLSLDFKFFVHYYAYSIECGILINCFSTFL